MLTDRFLRACEPVSSQKNVVSAVGLLHLWLNIGATRARSAPTKARRRG
jgi:hypothetical protein